MIPQDAAIKIISLKKTFNKIDFVLDGIDLVISIRYSSLLDIHGELCSYSWHQFAGDVSGFQAHIISHHQMVGRHIRPIANQRIVLCAVFADSLDRPQVNTAVAKPMQWDPQLGDWAILVLAAPIYGILSCPTVAMIQPEAVAFRTPVIDRTVDLDGLQTYPVQVAQVAIFRHLRLPSLQTK